jgi:hypothetical protein
MNESETIKKGLKCDDCSGCPYNNLDNGCDWSEEYALAYIEQLEAANNELLTKVEQLETKCHQLERERDAALNDVSLFPECGTCKYDPRKKGYIPNDCDDCVGHCNWVWRGVKEG